MQLINNSIISEHVCVYVHLHAFVGVCVYICLCVFVEENDIKVAYLHMLISWETGGL